MKKGMGMIDKLPKHKVVLNPKSYRMAHPVYASKDIDNVHYTHRPPTGIRDRLAHLFVKSARFSTDLLTRYDPDKMDERQWLNRCIFLETVAGIPGMVGGMARHMRSLRTLERDHGWIHHLMQEAENERMHLFFFLRMRNPGILFRLLIAAAQGVFFNAYFLMYLLTPSTCHRFVGYLEEEAVHTYTVLLSQIDKGQLETWVDMPAHPEAREYYSLSDKAVFRDVILAIRADEACHREVNHHFADIPQYAPVDHLHVTIKEDENKLKFSQGLPEATAEEAQKQDKP